MPSQRTPALRLQAGYYIATGAWPLLSRSTFEAVTGAKKDWWLVQMVGLLALTNGAAIAAGTRNEDARNETLILSLLSALSFAAIDIVYALERRISPVYLADAALELLLIAYLLSTK